MNERVPAEVFPPGDWIREALDDRGWSQADLADILGRPSQLVNELIAGKKIVTPETAKGLAQAFEGTTAEFWLNADSAWQLHLKRSQAPDPSVGLRARIYSKAPIREMVKRQWIEFSSNPSVLEKTLLDFLEVQDLNESPPVLATAARMGTGYDQFNASQLAWICRAKHLGRAVPVSRPFDKRSRQVVWDSLRLLMADPTEIRHVPRVLSEAGIRFLVLEHLTKTRIDGACIWLDRSSPVVVVSLRYGRIDNFWFTLMHELAHVFNGDGREDDPAVDIDLVGEAREAKENKPERERKADEVAEGALIDGETLDDFVTRVGPLFSERTIRNFATLHGVHPGIVVGQLHNRGVHYSKFRKLLVNVREHIVQSALTDGWGHRMPLAS